MTLAGSSVRIARMNVGNIVVGVGSLISGIKLLGDALGEIQTAGKEVAQQFKGDGTTPQAKLHEVGYDIKDRVKHIRDMTVKGSLDPKVRGFAVKVVSSRCALCPSCRTRNVLTAAGGGERIVSGAVKAVYLDPTRWKCGNCGAIVSMERTAWCVPEKDARREVEAIFNAVRANIRYVRDVDGVDTYQHPKRTLAWGGADCDDFTIVLGSMLKSIGYPVRARVMETKDIRTGRRVGAWNHIILLCGLPPRAPSGWLPLDASVNKPAGWYPPKQMIYRTKDFPL